MSDTKDGLALWHQVERTDPAMTKQFSRGGGFRGTAISPMYLIKKATELWGPMGGKWGVRIQEQGVFQGAPLVNGDGQILGEESVHWVLAIIFHPYGEFPCFGQTQLVGRNKNGFYTDEEAPKKSLTDALTKGLSWLGFAADVHMGRYDDVKYVSQITEEFRREAHSGLREQAMKVLRGAAAQGRKAMEKAWKSLSEDARQACQSDPEALDQLKELAEQENANAAVDK